MTTTSSKTIQNTLKNLKINLFILPVFIITSLAMHSEASFDDLGMGARATGMNNAFTAVADDAYSVYYNPAGLTQLKYPEIASTYGKLMMGLSDDSNLGNSFLVYAHPLKIQGDDGIVRDIGTLAIAWQEFKLGSLYRENAFYLSYASMLLDKLGFGVNLKSLRRAYGCDDYTENAIDQYGNSRGDKDPVFEGGRSKDALSADAGFQYTLGSDNQYRIGLSFLNINKPNMALKGTDSLPVTTKLGFLYKNQFANVSLDISRKKTLESMTDTIVSSALEKWMNTGSYGTVGVRGGLGIGSREYRNVSFGASYRIYAVQFDYGFSLPLSGIEDSMGSHRVSLSFRFGDQDPSDDVGKLILEEEKLYQMAQEALREAQTELELSKKEAELAQQEVEINRKKLHLDESGEALKRAKVAELKAKQTYERASNIAFEFYKKRIGNNIGLKEKQIILEKIIEKYSTTGASTKKLEDELSSVLKQIKAAEKEYRSEMTYYKKMRHTGATTEDQKAILNRIIEKYRPLGVNLEEAVEEKARLSD